MKEEKNIMNAAELNEEELEKVDGGSKKLDPGKKLNLGSSVTPSKMVIIGDGKRGSCNRCGAYTFINDEGYCDKCQAKRDRGE